MSTTIEIDDLACEGAGDALLHLEAHLGRRQPKRARGEEPRKKSEIIVEHDAAAWFNNHSERNEQ